MIKLTESETRYINHNLHLLNKDENIMVKITDHNDWFVVWYTYKADILRTMVANLLSDLKAGYDYFGKSVTAQREKIDAYKKDFDKQVEEYEHTTLELVNRKCYYELLLKGVIE